MPYDRTEVGHGDNVKPIHGNAKPSEPDVVELQDNPDIVQLLEEVQRATHDGVFNYKPVKYEFKNTQFVAWLQDMKHNRKGDVIISLMIPYRYRIFAYPLGDALGIPLSIDVQRWKRYEQYREALARAAGDDRDLD